MPQPRYNPRTQRDVWYYRIKESFHDLTGRIRSRSMLNVGFIDEPSRSHIVKYYDTKEIGEFPDSTKAVNAEGCHHGGNKCPWREGTNETLQRTEQVCR